VLASEGDHIKAADLASAAARKGITLPRSDALIAAQALNRRATLFTRDGDFAPVAALAGLQARVGSAGRIRSEEQPPTPADSNPLDPEPEGG